MPAPTSQRVWILSEPPVAEIKPETFTLETRDLPALKDGEVLLAVEYFSNEPAQRTWMDATTDERRLYAPPIKKGQPVTSIALARVVESKSAKWKAGQRVTGSFAWYDYGVAHESAITGEAVDVPGHPLISLNQLGLVGLTAHAGMFDILDIKPEHVVAVSGAAGAVGSIVVQIAKKVVGCKKVVGIAGGPEKCRWVESLGADVCVDYKAPDFAERLAEALPDYADRYFENVAGGVLDAMLPLTKRYGTIAVCGAIAGYHGKPLELKNFREVVYNRLKLHGFILTDHAAKFPEMLADLKGWYDAGKFETTETETVVEAGIEGVPEAWQRLFTGGNRGKLITKLV